MIDLNYGELMRLSRSVLTLSLVSFVMSAYGEVYQRTDAKGRMHFSDSPLTSYQASGYGKAHASIQTKIKKSDHKALANVAKRLKKDRLQREAKRKQVLKKSYQKRKKQQKILAIAKQRKTLCRLARKKEDLAFRKRGQGQNLTQMRNALANYEKKRDIRKLRCQ